MLEILKFNYFLTFSKIYLFDISLTLEMLFPLTCGNCVNRF